MTEVPARMRVARLHRWGDVRIEQMDVPRPAAHEAVIRVDACGVCGTDALAWYVDRKAPAVLGHEPVGTIVEVGAGVRSFTPGDRVFVHHHAPCMKCENCRRRLWSSCQTWKSSRIDPGGFAEYARVPALNLERDTFTLPAGLDFDTASFIEPLACCIRAVSRKAGVAPDDVVWVVGLGAMGLLMVQLARVYGARFVAGSDFNPERRAHALSLGADVVLDPAEPRSIDELMARTDGRGADVVLVTPAVPAAIDSAVRGAAPGARVVCFTPLPPDQPLSIDQCALYFKEIALLQSYSCGPDETREALALLSAGQVEVAAIATHRGGLEDVSAALERAKSGRDGLKTIIYPGH